MKLNSNTIVKEDCFKIIKDNQHILKQLDGKRILITGANGFLMSYLVDVIAYWNHFFSKKKCLIFALDNSSNFKRLSYLKGRKDIKLINQDICNIKKIEKNIQYIVHGASIASPPLYRKFPLQTLDANVIGTRKILENIKKNKNFKSFLFLSTSEVYGDPSSKFIPTSENYNGNVSFTGPRACYDESKRIGETICNIFAETYKLPIKVVRLFNVYGPLQDLNDKRITPDLMRYALNNKKIILFGGNATRTFCYVSDAISAMLKILLIKKTKILTFNVGHDRNEITIKKLSNIFSEIVLGILNKKLQVILKKSNDKDYLKDNPVRRRPNINLAKKELNWRPKIDIYAGLTRTLKSYLNETEKK